MNSETTATDAVAPRWLSADEQRSWRALLDNSRTLFALLEGQLQRDSGMSLASYSILVTLADAPRRNLRMGELAELTRSSSSRISHAIARLEGLGWVRRDILPDNRRVTYATLTPAGEAAVQQAAPGHVAAVREHLIDPLSAEQLAQLAQILGAVGAAAARSLDAG